MQSSILKIIVVLFLFSIVFPLKIQAVTIPDPLCDPADPTCDTTFADIIDKIINFILYLGAAIFPIMASIAGFLFLSSGGDTTKVKKAKDLLLYSVIGLFIVLLARGIISVIESVIGGS